MILIVYLICILVCGLASVATGTQRVPRLQGFSTGLDDGRVVGGVEAVPHSLPWMAILVSQKRNYAPFCGGSIISDKYILSAAHCHDQNMTVEDLKVILGEHDRCLQDKVTGIFSVDKVLKHPSFRHTDFFADIMLLRLSMRISFNRVIRPICLPPPGSSYENNWAVVSGWGTQNSSGPLQCSLKQTTIPILSQQECALKSKYPPSAMHATLFCAGLLVQGGRDSCQGDSGGPLQLVHPRSRRYTLVGIVSNGIGCGLPNYPGLYTAVSKFIGWIAASTQDSAYCYR
ncbi:trypsin-1-like [Cloeon dipterum]|uniref:trypsin-1-like n=1 Tax=Cloeon dipterum TaxID=197152 RepID=UPI0032204E5D